MSLRTKSQDQTKPFLLVWLMSWLAASSCCGALTVLDSAVNPVNRHTYYLLENSNWTNAEAQAVLLGGHLVTINDQAENEWLFDLWGNERSLWVGLNDAANEGTFVWVSGEPVVYTNWRSGEPNNGGTGAGNEDYVYIYAGVSGGAPEQWNDYQNSNMVFPEPLLHGVVEVACACPANIITNTAPGQCGAIVTFSWDNCPGTTKTCTPPSGSEFLVGTTTVSCMAVDTGGNTNTCSFTVRVTDNEKPTMVCLNIASNMPAGQCEMVVNYTVTATDNCMLNRPVTVVCVPPSGSLFAKGTTPVNCTATDAAGNTNTCTFTVTLDLASAGPVVLMGIDAEDGGPGGHGPISTWQTLVSNVLNRATGGTGLLVIGGGKSPFDFVTQFWNAIGTSITETTTFINTSNRIATQSFASFRMIAIVSDVNNVTSGGLTVPENNALRDRVPDIVAFLNRGGGLIGLASQFPTNFGTAGPYAYMAGLGAITIRSQDFINIDPTPEGLLIGINDTLDVDYWHQYFVTFPSFLRVLSYVGGTSNPAAIGGSQVSILLTCPNAVTVPCTTNVTLTAQIYNAECRLLTVTWRIDGNLVQTNFVPANSPNVGLALTSTYLPGVHTVTVTVDSGTSSQTCSTTVTVDNGPPTVFCPPPSEAMTNTEPGQCSAIVNYVVRATDTCSGVVNTNCTPPAGSRFQRGQTPVNCTARDGAGNTGACSFTVVVNDRERPRITCPSDIVTNTAPGQCGREVFFSPSVADNCPGATFTCNPPAGSFFSKRVTTVNCTASDLSLNTTNCSFTITVNDTEPPELSCPDEILANVPPNECTAPINFSVEVTDNCPGATFTCNPPSGAVFSNRVTTVVCTGQDAANNTNQCSFAVILNGSMTITPLANVRSCSGGVAQFSTMAIGDGPFTFGWRLDGQSIGTNGPTLSVPSAGLTFGDHTVVVTVSSPCGSASNSAVLTIGGLTTATALTNATRCVCESVTFHTEVAGGAASFVWKANGRVLEGATSNTLVLRNLQDSDAGLYTVEVMGFCNNVTNSATLTLDGTLLNPASFTNAATILFNDFSAGSPYPSVINVKCIPGVITRLSVTLNRITHSFPDDMDVLLVSPSRQKLKLMSDVGGNRPNGISGVVLTFDDAAPAWLGDTNLLVSGTYRPTDFETNDSFASPVPAGPYLTNFFGFSGDDPNGTWSLFVADDLRGDTGQITDGWKLHIEWAPRQLTLRGPALHPDGSFHMTISNSLAGQSYVVEASADLQTWIPVETNIASGSLSTFIHPQASNHTRRFYRVVRCQ